MEIYSTDDDGGDMAHMPGHGPNRSTGKRKITATIEAFLDEDDNIDEAVSKLARFARQTGEIRAGVKRAKKATQTIMSAFNGFIAGLSEEERKALASTPNNATMMRDIASICRRRAKTATANPTVKLEAT
jgi:hypothetical protein